MRKLLALVAILSLGMASTVWADSISGVVSPTTVNPRNVTTVFNDNGSAVTSGTIVSFDDDDTDFSSSGYPYVVTTTTADDPYTLGVMLTGSCADQTLCEVVTYGPIDVLCDDSSDAVGADTLVGVSGTTAGYCGDYNGGNDEAYLGVAIGAGAGTDGNLIKVFVDPGFTAP